MVTIRRAEWPDWAISRVQSRAEVPLGSASIRLAANTGMSFLSLDDRTVQIQLTSGTLNIRARRLNCDEVYEIDGESESTGSGQTFTLHAGEKGTFAVS